MKVAAVVFAILGILFLSAALIIPIAASVNHSKKVVNHLAETTNPISDYESPDNILTDCSIIPVPCNSNADCKTSCMGSAMCDVDSKKCRPPKPNLECNSEAGCYWAWIGSSFATQKSERTTKPGRWQRRCRFPAYYGDLGKGCAPLNDDGYPIVNSGICAGGMFIREDPMEAPNESHCFCPDESIKFLREDGTPYCVKENSLPGDVRDWYGDTFQNL